MEAFPRYVSAPPRSAVHELVVGPSAADTEAVAAHVSELACHEQRFGVLLRVQGANFERLASQLTAAVRAQPGGRAAFSAWCVGVAVTFEPSHQRAAAHAPLRRMPFALGAEVVGHEDVRAAISWLGEQLEDFPTAPPPPDGVGRRHRRVARRVRPTTQTGPNTSSL
jgi:hypothetical protein